MNVLKGIELTLLGTRVIRDYKVEAR
jgi:hypothetical protein